MFKNCCVCTSKKTKREDVDEDEDEEEKKEKERDNQINKVIEEEKKEATAREIAQKTEMEAGSGKQKPAEEEAKPPERKSSLKKPKPRLSISTEVKIIPSNFPEGMPDYPDEAEAEEPAEVNASVEEEDEEEEEEGLQLSVKNIDGKIIMKSEGNEEVTAAPTPEVHCSGSNCDRPVSPLSDEVFDAGEKSALDQPLHNLGVKVGSTQTCGGMLDIPSPSRCLPFPSAKRSSMPAVLHKWLSEEEDEMGGTQEPPVTPVARDELALRRHRFFSELLSVAQAATEHRVRFDPFGPTVEQLSDLDQGPVQQLQAKEFEALLARLENITTRLEKALPVLEESIEPLRNSGVVVTKSLEDLLDEHLTPDEKKNLNLLIGREKEEEEEEEGQKEDGESAEEEEEGDEDEGSGSRKDDLNAISPDSSADIEDLSDKDITLEANADRLLNGQSDGSENSSNSQSTVVRAREDETKADSPVAVSELSSCGNGLGSESVEEGLDTRKEAISGSIDMTNSQSTLSMSVPGFQDILQGPFATYLQVSGKIGGDVAEHSKLVQQAFQAQLQYLSLASQSSRPSDIENSNLLKPTSDHIQAIQNYREKHRASSYFNHLSAVSESIPALGWVTITPAPAPYIKEMNDAGQFYTNRVLKDWKEKDKIHADWTKAWIQTLSELQAYVKQYHTTGLVWSGKSAPSTGGIPPPPPVGMPPPPPAFDLGALAHGDSKQDRSALFAEINQGENITKGLKKVTADMQTHKNPAIRAGPAPFKTPSYVTNQTPMPYKAPSPPEKPAKFGREGKKWIIEYQKGKHDLVVSEAEMNNVIYIFKCSDSTVTVKGKVNSIFVDSCKKTAVVFENVVSSIEFINCQSVQMQVLGKVPTISVDKTDGCQMYLSGESLDTEIISSKSSEMNVLVPTRGGDFTEYPIPEQYKTTIGNKGLTTISVESKG